MEYLDSLLEGIRAGHSDLLVDVAFVFEKHRGLGKNYTQLQQAAALGWTDKVIKIDFSDNDIALLKVNLVQFIQNNPAHSNVGTAIWALGKLFDVSLKPTLIAILQQQISRNAGALYQTMIALDYLGENIFGDRLSRSILDVHDNLSMAEDYLRRSTKC